MPGLFGRISLARHLRREYRNSLGTPLNKLKPSQENKNNTGAITVNGETSPISVGLLSLHTAQTEASKNLEKKRKFSEVEGTQGQVILG